jgi:hypothetical protein
MPVPPLEFCPKSSDHQHRVDPESLWHETEMGDDKSWPVAFRCAACGRDGDMLLGPEEIWAAIQGSTEAQQLIDWSPDYEAMAREQRNGKSPKPRTKKQTAAANAQIKKIAKLLGRR